MFLLDFDSGLFWTFVSLLAVPLSLFSAGHALIRKRDARSAFAWIAVCLFIPVFGALLYYLFGINRIQAKGKTLSQRWPPPDNSDLDDPEQTAQWPSEYVGFTRYSRKVTSRRFEPGNDVGLLINGEQAYPAMLQAIGQANDSIALCTYIFENDEVGLKFVDALAEAVKRGVDVKVLVDGMGEKYSFPGISGVLTRKGIRVEQFLPWDLRRFSFDINLRNHRKILVIDGKLAFTGGMNIGARHLAEAEHNPKKALDLHFRVEGPVVADIERVFLEDWSFVTGQDCIRQNALTLADAGELFCRVVIDGPNDDFEKLHWMYLGATNAARESIRIMTPYFVPNREFIAALCAANMRGVEVQLILPEENNLPLVGWATNAMLWQVLEHEVQVYRQPPPFNHSKLFIVDDCYAMVGSANLDARSLRLNFELNLEIYGEQFVTTLAQYFHDARLGSTQVTLAGMDGRPLMTRLRDGLARLLTPYL